MKQQYQQFIFERIEVQKEQGLLFFHYSYDSQLHFVEKIDVGEKITKEIPEQLLFALHLVLGMSYWKAYCAPEMVIRSGALTKEQAYFWNTVYTKGLGEFFFINSIDFRGLVNFPFDEKKMIEPHKQNSLRESALLPIGGGKDSLYSFELLSRSGIPFSTYTLNQYDLIETQQQEMHVPQKKILRTIDPALFECNARGAYNGHVPISSLYAFTAALQAILSGDRYIIFSNERSANIGNVAYLGEMINHQWSKSVECEKLIQNYLKEYIHPDLYYYSLLRPLYEIAIVERFVAYKKWFSLFSSCNRNFGIQKKASQRWCGSCPKCAFVFLLFAAFLSKEETLSIFGKNLFTDETLIPLFTDLMGKGTMKPFDCVGTTEEVLVAFFRVQQKGFYNDDVVIESLSPLVEESSDDVAAMEKEVFSLSTEHHIPKNHFSLLYGSV